jgi:hypothetical protein
MSRLRKTPSSHCMTCRRTSYASDAERSMIALHRMEHARLDNRRAQWRKYSQGNRKRDNMREKHYPHLLNAIGALHDPGCKIRHYGRKGNCIAIPVYAGTPEGA